MRASLLPPLSIVAGMMVLGISDNFIWMVSDLMSVWQFHAVRAAMVLPAMALVIWMIGQLPRVRVQRPGAVFLRAFFTVSALLLYFAAIPAVGVSLAAAGLFTSPIFVVLVSVTVFGERIGWHRALGVVLGFAGVCLVLEIGSEPLRAMALAPMLGGLLYGLNVIWTRRYCRQEAASALAFWNMAAFLLLGAVGVAATPWVAGMIGHVEGTDFATMALQPMGWRELAVVFAMGICGSLGMVLLAYGYTGAPSTYAALFDYSFLIWVPLFAWILWDDTLAWHEAAGVGLIIAAGCLAVAGIRHAEEVPS